MPAHVVSAAGTPRAPNAPVIEPSRVNEGAKPNVEMALMSSLKHSSTRTMCLMSLAHSRDDVHIDQVH